MELLRKKPNYWNRLTLRMQLSDWMLRLPFKKWAAISNRPYLC